MTIKQIPLSSLRESSSNPRQTFGRIDELAANLKQMGVLQPLIVRPLTETTFEIVSGHRRGRAAKVAKLESVPCDVRTLTDEQVLEIQLAENLQRQDITELEEAETFGVMIERHKYTPDAIAKKLGISDGTVYGRLKLLSLGTEPRKALADGVLPSSVAVPLARLPAEHQAKAFKEIKSRFLFDGEESISARLAVDFLQKQFSRPLRLASFDVKDDMLIDGAGPCAACPKNTKCAKPQPGLFDDFSKADRSQAICTDVACFDAKTAATWAVAVAGYEAQGIEVLSAEVGHNLFRFEGQINHASGYIELDAPNHADPQKRTWRDAYEKIPVEQRPPMTIAPDRSFKPRTLVDEKLLIKALGESPKAPKWARAESERKEEIAQAKAEAKEASAAADSKLEVQEAALHRLAARALNDVALRFILAGLGSRWTPDQVKRALGLTTTEDYERFVRKADGRELRHALLVWGAFSADFLDGDAEDPVEWKQLVKEYDVDLRALEREREAAVEAEQILDEKKKKPAKKKGGK